MNDIGSIAKILPTEALNQLAQTVCETFEKIIYPITATTEGIGKLIQTKFESLNIQQQIIATKCFQETKEKIDRIDDKKEHVVIKPLVIYEALDSTEQQTDETMRSLWSNLLAREFTDGSVHPEIAKLLSKITSQDAIVLNRIAIFKDVNEKEQTFNHIHLMNLDLINDIYINKVTPTAIIPERGWSLSITGEEFIRCVSDPK